MAGTAPTYNIQLLHPEKTGGSTLGGIFQRYAIRHNSSSNLENCEAFEGPCIQIAKRRKALQTIGGSAVLNVLTIRAPLDRLVSGYFQAGGGCTIRSFQEWATRSPAQQSVQSVMLGVNLLNRTSRPCRIQRSCSASPSTEHTCSWRSGTNLEALDHLQLTDRLDEGLVLLHLRSSIPIWELLHLNSKLRAPKAPAEESHSHWNQCFAGRVGSTLQRVAAWFRGDETTLPNVSMSALSKALCSMPREQLRLCKGLLTSATLSKDELAAARRTNGLDEWLWLRAQARYYSDRCELLRRHALSEAELETMVEAFSELNRAYHQMLGCTTSAAWPVEWHCEKLPWLLKASDLPVLDGRACARGVGSGSGCMSSTFSGLMAPIAASKAFARFLPRDDMARRGAYADGRSKALQARDQLLLRTFYRTRMDMDMDRAASRPPSTR